MLTSTILSAFFAVLPLASAFGDSSNNNVAIYWGQNSAGKDDSQKNLAYYCESDASDIVLVSFLNDFFDKGGKPSINLGPSCGGTLFDGTNLLSCPDVGKDIQTCQSKGKKILLSLGGASGSYGFTSSEQAKEFADTLWDLFAGGSSDTRPFGDVSVDGFDLDVEGGSNSYYNDFVNQMRSHYSSDSSKKYYISGAPQCPLPDHMLNGAMTTSDFDFYFVQFYNNYCGVNTYGSDNFNFAAWDQFAKSSSFNKNAKVFLGVPGGPSAAGSGYIPADKVIEIAKELQSKYSSFGGVSVWDASQAWANNDFADVVKRGLGSDAPAAPAPATSDAPAAPAPVTSDVVIATSEEIKNVATTTIPTTVATVTAPFAMNSTVATTSISIPAGTVTAEVTYTSTTTSCDTEAAAVATPEDTNTTPTSVESTPAPVPTTEYVTMTKFLPLESCGCVAN